MSRYNCTPIELKEAFCYNKSILKKIGDEMDLMIKQGQNEFYIGPSSDEAVARITYKASDKENVIVANHTFVDPTLRGQNIAKLLLDRLADYAREENLTIHPTCSYVVKAFEKFDAYDDVK